MTSAPGRILGLDLDSLALQPLSPRIGTLDGLERLGAGLLVSEFNVGVYYVTATEPPVLILDAASEGLAASADIGVAQSERLLAVPEFSGNRVTSIAIAFLRAEGAR